jgi:D-glycero-alpha-D-manno-heptose-7-phosphate kinase
MLISRTPFRISFFGGGSDYPTWFAEHGGRVLSTTINNYVYVTCRQTPAHYESPYRYVGATMLESQKADHIAEISHPIVRAVLSHYHVPYPIELISQSDLPTSGGLGSSSSFTVGLLHAIFTLMHRPCNKSNLAKEAIFTEQTLLQDMVGVQDQIAAAYGGLNDICIATDGNFTVTPISITPERKQALLSHLLLIYTGGKRSASFVASQKVAEFKEKQADIHAISAQVAEGKSILESSHTAIAEFGHLLHQAWEYKRGLAGVSNQTIDEFYTIGQRHGALGGKLLGAGGSGFMLFFAPPECHAAISAALAPAQTIPFTFEEEGSIIIPII